MTSKAIFVQTVRSNTALPAILREHADDVRGLEEHQFNHSYLEFLDEQIRLSPRGPDWTERPKRRRTDLLPFCEMTLLRGNVRVGESDFAVEIDPKNGVVIHWEQYEFEPGT